MGKFNNIIGQKYGRLLVLEKTERRVKSGGSVIWSCLCDCGKTVEVSSASLVGNQTKSCGCLFLEVASEKGQRMRQHGMTKTPTYRSWSGAKDRCQNSKNRKYHLYGGRGIFVCERWSEFGHFLEDMGVAPLGHSLDRIDVNGGYEPGNCRWATQLEQQNNRRDNVMITFGGERLTMAMYCRKHGLNEDKVQQRLKRGCSVEQAIKP